MVALCGGSVASPFRAVMAALVTLVEGAGGQPSCGAERPPARLMGGRCQSRGLLAEAYGAYEVTAEQY